MGNSKVMVMSMGDGDGKAMFKAVGDIEKGYFMKKHVSLKAPLNNLDELINEDCMKGWKVPRLRNVFKKHYLPHLGLKDGLLMIQNEEVIIKREKLISVSISSITSTLKKSEMLLSNESAGGIYQTITVGSIWKICDVIKKIYRVDPDQIFCDVGCGQNRVVWIATQILGCFGVGVEICPHRTKIAINSATELLKGSMLPWNKKVALIHRDAKKPANWKGCHIFFVWDTVFTEETVDGIYQNIIGSFDNDQEEKVLIHSKSHKSRLQKLEELFDVMERETITMTFHKGKSTTTMIILKVKRKMIRNPTITISKRALRVTADKFFKARTSLASYSNLKEGIERKEVQPESIRKRQVASSSLSCSQKKQKTSSAMATSDTTAKSTDTSPPRNIKTTPSVPRLHSLQAADAVRRAMLRLDSFTNKKYDLSAATKCTSSLLFESSTATFAAGQSINGNEIHPFLLRLNKKKEKHDIFWTKQFFPSSIFSPDFLCNKDLLLLQGLLILCTLAPAPSGKPPEHTSELVRADISTMFPFLVDTLSIPKLRSERLLCSLNNELVRYSDEQCEFLLKVFQSFFNGGDQCKVYRICFIVKKPQTATVITP
jgi:hypothetical protein